MLVFSESKYPDVYLTKSSLHYFIGNCCDPRVQSTIQEKFIELLSSSRFSTSCTAHPSECSVRNVKVTCPFGACNGRRKRDTDQQQMETRIEAEISIDAKPFRNLSSEEALTHARAELSKFSDVMKEYLPGLNVSQELGLSMTFKGLEFGRTQIGCPAGTNSATGSLACGQ